jgi:hypothetical protein
MAAVAVVLSVLVAVAAKARLVNRENSERMRYAGCVVDRRCLGDGDRRIDIVCRSKRDMQKSLACVR